MRCVVFIVWFLAPLVAPAQVLVQLGGIGMFPQVQGKDGTIRAAVIGQSYSTVISSPHQTVRIGMPAVRSTEAGGSRPLSELIAVVAPNPVIDQLRLTLPITLADIVRVEIFSLEGIRVYTQSHEARLTGSRSVHLNDIQLTNGWYILTVFNEKPDAGGQCAGSASKISIPFIVQR